MYEPEAHVTILVQYSLTNTKETFQAFLQYPHWVGVMYVLGIYIALSYPLQVLFSLIYFLGHKQNVFGE